MAVNALLVLVVVAIVLVAAFAVVWVLRRRPAPAPPPPPVPPAEDASAREARHRSIDRRGSELLDRRVELDGRRGTLAGHGEVEDEFDRLEASYRAGEISEEQFEAAKIRLLGG